MRGCIHLGDSKSDDASKDVMPKDGRAPSSWPRRAWLMAGDRRLDNDLNLRRARMNEWISQVSNYNLNGDSVLR